MEIFNNRAEERAFLEERLGAMPAPLEVLEAGCGNKPLFYINVSHKLTGVDTDARAMEIRRRKYNDIHEFVLADLRSAQFTEARFDVIYCSYVLEHIDGAERVLENFVYWLKPGGLMILRVPDRNSAYGIITRYTPFWFHVLVKRYLMGKPQAGSPGYDPYPVFYDEVISGAGMTQFCEKHKLKMEAVICSGYYLQKSRLLKYAAWLVSKLSQGKLPWEHNNLTFIVRKQ